MTKLDKFCMFTPLKVFGISFFISLVVLLILTVTSDNTINKETNRYGESSYMPVIIYGGCMIYSVLCSLCSYTIFINRYRTIRDNGFLSFLTFFWFVVLISLVTFIVQGISEDVSSGLLMSLYAGFLFIPFVIPQIYYFVKFRKRLKSGEILEGFYEDIYENS